MDEDTAFDAWEKKLPAQRSTWNVPQEHYNDSWEPGFYGKGVVLNGVDGPSLQHWKVDHNGWPHHVSWGQDEAGIALPYSERENHVGDVFIDPTGNVAASRFNKYHPDDQVAKQYQMQEAIQNSGLKFNQGPQDSYDPFGPDNWKLEDGNWDDPEDQYPTRTSASLPTIQEHDYPSNGENWSQSCRAMLHDMDQNVIHVGPNGSAHEGLYDVLEHTNPDWDPGRIQNGVITEHGARWFDDGEGHDPTNAYQAIQQHYGIPYDSYGDDKDDWTDQEHLGSYKRSFKEVLAEIQHVPTNYKDPNYGQHSPDYPFIYNQENQKLYTGPYGAYHDDITMGHPDFGGYLDDHTVYPYAAGRVEPSKEITWYNHPNDGSLEEVNNKLGEIFNAVPEDAKWKDAEWSE